ncbi:MAG TPA: phosphoglucosamine mutase, partial [archaeon]|nr:phosphoglucosamine mutase [archaeon]
DEDEKGIEEIIFSEEMSNDELNGASIGKAFRVEDAKGRYIEFAKASIGNESLKGFKIVVDCANGAAYSVAPEIFSELGAETIAINNSPDGLNINKNCGATDISSLSRKVVEAQADMGFALDGDADRLIVVDSKGKEVNGDKILGFIAEHLKSAGMLAKETVVATVMSNSALERHLSGAGIRMLRAPVGDRYVIEEMRKNGYNFGGEQSGHIIFGDYSTTGDGIITALQILKIMKAKNISVPDAFRLFELYPQVLVNVKVREKKPFEEMPRVLGEIDSASAALAGKGRVFVRYSGTENLARVMVEGENEAEIKEIVEKIALRIKEGIGVE